MFVHEITLYSQSSLCNHEHAALITTYGTLDKTPFELSANKKPLCTYEQFVRFWKVSSLLFYKMYGKTGNKKLATCFATLLQNELNSDVARKTTHEKKPCNLIFATQVQTWVVNIKRPTSLFNSF